MERLDLSSAAGFRWLFRPSGGDWSAIRVPEGGWKPQGFVCDSGTYRCDIPLPPQTRGHDLRVRFEAVNFGCRVLAGPSYDDLEPVTSHIGGWMPFEADITPWASAGIVRLEVHVDGRRRFLRDGRSLVPDGASWFEGLADGILRGVALLVRPPVHISDIEVRTSVTDDTIRVLTSVRNTTDRPLRFLLRHRLASDDGSTPAYPAIPDLVGALDARQEAVFDSGPHGWGLGPESFWWPNIPYREGYRCRLHRLTVELVEEAGTVLHRLAVRFGFREFRAVGDHYELNGIRCNLRGDNQQEANYGTDAYGVHPGFGPPTPANPGWPRAADNLLRLNFNVLRIHQIPATPYMLDVCDETGLMIVAETPIRGSEGLQDFVAGRPHMLSAVRELVRRDRHHPSVVLWSVANEIWGERELGLALAATAMAEDPTRPVIVEGVEDWGPPLINMEHYTSGLGRLPERGGTPRSDRPFGETEAVWPMDNSLQGWLWMSTGTRLRRLRRNADIRNYILNNCWPDHVPGQSRSLQVLEKAVKDIRWSHVTSGMEILPDLGGNPWAHPLVDLMRRSFHPYLVLDTEFDETNKTGGPDGRWPDTIPRLKADSVAERTLAVFNDGFGPEVFDISWTFSKDTDDTVRVSGTFRLFVPRGTHRLRRVRLEVPPDPGPYRLRLRSSADGVELFSDSLPFEVTP